MKKPCIHQSDVGHVVPDEHCPANTAKRIFVQGRQAIHEIDSSHEFVIFGNYFGTLDIDVFSPLSIIPPDRCCFLHSSIS